MNILELPAVESSTEFILQSALCLRTAKAGPRTVLEAVLLAQEIASEGASTPPLGFLFDLASIACGEDHLQSSTDIPSEHGLFRRYDDYVLGRLYGDQSLQRAGYALPRYAERERIKALSYLAQRVCERAKLPGAQLNPAAFKLVAADNLEQQLQRAWDKLLRDGVNAALRGQLIKLCDQMRVAGPLVGVEDVFELEQKLALRPLSDRVALRHAWQASEFFRTAMPKDRPTAPRAGREVATRIEDEDQYPVGGYSSLANRGSMESLLHSQLAYMEDNESPDLFDIKLVRNELLYFARDENTFYRRRKTILIRLDDSLTSARIKDLGLGWQRLSLACGLILCAVRLFDEWLSDYALNWVVISEDTKEDALKDERELFRVALPEMIAAGRLETRTMQNAELDEFAASLRQKSELHISEFAATNEGVFSDQTGDTHSRLQVQASPGLWLDGKQLELDQEPSHAWKAAAERLIESWL